MPSIKLLLIEPENQILIQQLLSNYPLSTEQCSLNDSLTTINTFQPNVIILIADGSSAPFLDTAQQIRHHHHHTPIILMGNLSTGGATVALQSLKYGAVDCILLSDNPSAMEIEQISTETLAKIRYWSRSGLQGSQLESDLNLDDELLPALNNDDTENFKIRESIVPHKQTQLIVFTSTSDNADNLIDLLSVLNPLKIPVLLARHLSEIQTTAFVLKLEKKVKTTVNQSRFGEPLQMKAITVLEGGKNSTLHRQKKAIKLEKSDIEETMFYPCIDILLESIAENLQQALVVILGGSSDDVSEGTQLFAEKGWPVIVQNPNTCTEQTMPIAVLQQGFASQIMDGSEIIDTINQHFSADEE
jgi:two-component system, chemotaxis family, protein-glutamate methylesterase/glutaminase